MALITISGYPASGKTRRALQIKSHFETRLADADYQGPKFKVCLISDDTLSVNRDAYNGQSSRSQPVSLVSLWLGQARLSG